MSLGDIYVRLLIIGDAAYPPTTAAAMLRGLIDETHAQPGPHSHADRALVSRVALPLRVQYEYLRVPIFFISENMRHISNSVLEYMFVRVGLISSHLHAA